MVQKISKIDNFWRINSQSGSCFNTLSNNLTNMNKDQVEMIQSSWKQVLSYSKANPIEVFYTKLFEVGGEEIKGLFKSSDMKVQGKRLLDMLTMAVYMVGDLGNLKPKLEDLGKRHVKYGVKKEHYQFVGAALLYVLELALEEKWTKEMKDNWLIVWNFVSSSMIDASY